jgi:NAD(P)-dependent dehydrogenase (short-subunit alcohol dehydrogenase family)
MSESLEGKVALVTGGASGIGRGACLALAAAGASVVVADINEVRARATAAEIEAAGGSAWSVELDVSASEACNEGVEAAVDQGGRLDVLFHAAGTAGVSARSGNIEELSDEGWQHFIQTNLTGTFYMCRAVIPHLRRAGGGTITLMASGRLMLGMAGQTAYAASKGGVASFARSLAWEVGDGNINVNSIVPGLTETEGVREYQVEVVGADPNAMLAAEAARDPLGRVSTPADIGTFVVYLSTAGRWITGGMHVMRVQTR